MMPLTSVALEENTHNKLKIACEIRALGLDWLSLIHWANQEAGYLSVVRFSGATSLQVCEKLFILCRNNNLLCVSLNMVDSSV